MNETQDAMADGTGDEAARSRALWRRWAVREAAGETPDALTLAAYAEGRLGTAARAAVAAVLAADPDLAEDVAMARTTTAAPSDAALAAIVARASALVPATKIATSDIATPAARIVAFPAARRAGPSWRFAARWGALAASFAMVSYLGFALGSDASSNLVSLGQTASSGFADELLDPPSGFLGGAIDPSGT